MEMILFILVISVLGPMIGSLIGVLKRPTESFMFKMLSFAAGVMLGISFLQLIPESIELSSIWICIFGIVAGSVIMFGFDKLIPHINPELCQEEPKHRLKKTAVYIFFGIFLHNFPEGMAIGIGSVAGFKLSIAIALAIAVHDIPEAICTSAPYYYISKKRLKSFLVSVSTAIPTIVGFLFSYFLFQNIPLQIVGLLIAATAGLMIYISGDELIPTSCNKHNKNWDHGVIFALILGIVFVLLLKLI